MLPASFEVATESKESRLKCHLRKKFFQESVVICTVRGEHFMLLTDVWGLLSLRGYNRLGVDLTWL